MGKIYVGPGVMCVARPTGPPLSCQDSSCRGYERPAPTSDDLYCGCCGEPYPLVTIADVVLANKIRMTPGFRLSSTLDLGGGPLRASAVLWVPNPGGPDEDVLDWQFDPEPNSRVIHPDAIERFASRYRAEIKTLESHYQTVRLDLVVLCLF